MKWWAPREPCIRGCPSRRSSPGDSEPPHGPRRNPQSSACGWCPAACSQSSHLDAQSSSNGGSSACRSTTNTKKKIGKKNWKNRKKEKRSAPLCSNQKPEPLLDDWWAAGASPTLSRGLMPAGSRSCKPAFSACSWSGTASVFPRAGTPPPRSMPSMGENWGRCSKD